MIFRKTLYSDRYYYNTFLLYLVLCINIFIDAAKSHIYKFREGLEHIYGWNRLNTYQILVPTIFIFGKIAGTIIFKSNTIIYLL